jgi:mRNA-degrading endonuclease toxin of MazEF toxin-antitoxin module
LAYQRSVGEEPRPAIVDQADLLNALIADTVLVQITGTTRNAVTEVRIDPSAEPQSGLKHISHAVCNNFLTLDQARIHRRLGQLSAGTMQQIEAAVKTALELP